MADNLHQVTTDPYELLEQAESECVKRAEGIATREATVAYAQKQIQEAADQLAQERHQNDGALAQIQKLRAQLGPKEEKDARP